MSDDEATSVEAIKKALETYLRSRPLAADTIEGIATWWLSEDTRNASLDQVEMAVDELCRTNLLRRIRQESGVVVYRAATAPTDRDDEA